MEELSLICKNLTGMRSFNINGSIFRTSFLLSSSFENKLYMYFVRSQMSLHIFTNDLRNLNFNFLSTQSLQFDLTFNLKKVNSATSVTLVFDLFLASEILFELKCCFLFKCATVMKRLREALYVKVI